MVRALINIILLILFVSPSAWAGDWAFQNKYTLEFAGVRIGKVFVNFNQTATSYSARSDVALTGLAKLFVQHTSATTSRGTGADYEYPSSVYEAKYQTRKKPKYVKMERKAGKLTLEKVEPPDNRATRPAVAEDKKNGSTDPLFLAFAIRQNLERCLKDGCKTFSLRYYDGRRLTEVRFALAGEKTLRLSGKKHPTYVVEAKRTPLAGYTKNELDDIGSDDPTLSLYFSQDERMVPLLLEVPLPIGTATATLRM